MIKKILIFSLILVIFQCAFADGTVEKRGKDKKGDKRIVDTLSGNEWELYSYGLLYHNKALKQRDRNTRDHYLDLAIKHFKMAATFGKALDRIYAQISDSYYYRRKYSDSIEYAKKALEVNKTFIKPYNRLYNIYITMRDYQSAEEVLRQYIEVNPDSVQVRFVLAEHLYIKMRDYDKAIKAYQEVISSSERRPVEEYYKEQSYYRMGEISIRKRDIKKAQSYFQEVLKINKDHLASIQQLALISMDQYDLDEAEKHASRFLAMRPDNKRMYAIIGRVKYLRNDPSAISYLRKAGSTISLDGILSRGLYKELMRQDENSEKLLLLVLKYEPRIISVHMALARIHTRNGKKDQAFNEYLTAGVLMFRNKLYSGARYCFIEARKLEDSVQGVYYYLGRLNEEINKNSLAIYYYKEANNIKPDIELILHIGYLYGVKKDYNSAISYFDTALEKEPSNSKPYFFKGLISIWKEDYPEAEKNIKRAITLNDKSETYYFYFAVVMDKMKKIDEAIESLEKAIKYNPKSARAYNYLGYMYADNNMKLDRSLILIRRALEIDPGNGAYTDSLGWVFFRQGKYQQALKELLAAEQILKKSKSPDPVVFDHIGDTYKKMGEFKEALKYWKKSLEMKNDAKVKEKIMGTQENAN